MYFIDAVRISNFDILDSEDILARVKVRVRFRLRLGTGVCVSV